MTAPSKGPVVPRARGDVHLSVKSLDGASRINRLRQAGSLKVLFPRTDDTSLQAVLVNTAGGITGGDRFDLGVEVAPNASLTLSTQAAERAYRAQADQTGQVTTDITVGAQAQLHWLPQEMILFDGCRLRRRLRIDLAEGAGLLAVETLVFGRTAMRETVRSGLLDDRIELRRNGAPCVLDAVRMSGDMAAELARPAVAGGREAVSTVIYVAPDAEARLPAVRALIGEDAGASLLAEDVLFARILGQDGYVLRQSLMPLLTELSAAALPRPWMI